MNETTERPHKVPRPRLSTQLAHSHCLQTLVKNADFYGRRQARQNCQLHCPLVRVFLLNRLFWLQSSGGTLSTNVSDEREIRAITLHDTPSSDCFFLQSTKQICDEGRLLSLLRHGRTISLNRLRSNTRRCDATRGSGFGTERQTSV